MRLATWNINSIRLRLSNVLRFVKDYDIDVLCLQETKTPDEHFPLGDFNKVGLTHSHFRGEKSYNGVAILSRLPIAIKKKLNWCGLFDTRHVSVVLANKITIHNFYVPAGGDIPDINNNPKFKHKIQFLKEMINYFKKDKTKNKVLVGDLNIAPLENDVWSHKQLLNVVSHTLIETNYLKELINTGNWLDVIRENFPPEEKLYSWWSYRNRNWKKSNKGRRLDHILVSNDLKSLVGSRNIYKELRDWEKPSDHVPVVIDIEL